MPAMDINETNRILRSHDLPYICKRMTAGGGNCFFHAIVDQLKDEVIAENISNRSKLIDISDHIAVREAVIEFCRHDNDLLNSDWNGWKDEYVASEREKSHFSGLHEHVVWRALLDEMEKSGAWTDWIFVTATALFFGKDIHIIKSNYHYKLSGNMYGQHPEDPPFAMVLLNEVHFQSVRRLIKGNGNNQPWWRRICNIF